MKDIGTQTLESKRLILRKICQEDAPFIFKNWTHDPLVTKYVTWDLHPTPQTSEEYALYKAKRYSENFRFDWIVVLKSINEPIGEIEACKVDIKDRIVEMGYCFGSAFWNQGYATEALQTFIHYMLNQVEVDKVYARYMSSNPASGKAMQKAGMSYDATLKNYAYDEYLQKRVDLIYYSITRS